MSHAPRIIDSLNRSKASTVAFLEELWQDQQRLVLTFNGERQLLVQDAGSYRLLLELVERLETIDGVKHSMEAFESGESRPAREALEEFRQKYGLSG
jgi:hypothetical protein